MTTKQYTGLLAIICVLASPFAANQWFNFAKAQREYQEHLENQQLVEIANKALNSITPVRKQWNRFAQSVDWLQKNNDKNGEEGDSGWKPTPQERADFPWLPGASGCRRELLIQLAAAIRKQDFNGFNELMKRVPQETLKIYFHYPDLTEPGLTEADVQDLSKFIKPKTKVEAVK